MQLIFKVSIYLVMAWVLAWFVELDLVLVELDILLVDLFCYEHIFYIDGPVLFLAIPLGDLHIFVGMLHLSTLPRGVFT